jgi:hypothetical protein
MSKEATMARTTKPSYYWCVAKPNKKKGKSSQACLYVPFDGGPFGSVRDCLNDALRTRDSWEYEDQFSKIWIGTEITTALSILECSSANAVNGVFGGITAELSCAIGSGDLLPVEEEEKSARAELSSFVAQWAPTFLSSEQPRLVLASATKYQLPDDSDSEEAALLAAWLDDCPKKLSAEVRSLLQEKVKADSASAAPKKRVKR